MLEGATSQSSALDVLDGVRILVVGGDAECASCSSCLEQFGAEVRSASVEGVSEACDDFEPDIILVSMPSHGKTGPESHHVAYGTNVEQLSGLASISGYPGDGPHKSPIAYGDPNAGAIAAAAALAALHHRRQTGEGQHIEVAQWEALTGNIGEYILAYQMSGQEPERIGNRHISRVQNVYRCKDGFEDSWVAISIASDAEFAALCDVIGRPELTRDPRFADVVSRRHNQDALDPIISEWTAARTQRGRRPIPRRPS